MNINEITQTKERLKQIKKEADEKLQELELLSSSIKEQEKGIKVVAESLDKGISDLIEKDKFIKFFEKPYALISIKRNQLLIAVPKFIKGFQVGWLWKETDNFYIYQLNQYSAWLGEVPKDLLENLNLEEQIKAEVIEDKIYFEPSQKELVKSKLKNHLRDFTETSARIIKGHEFNLIADMISQGTLPFRPNKVSESDQREEKGEIVLRDYQKPAFEKFFETGAIGLFHPTGAGKSFISLKIMDKIKGKKLIVVPSLSLVEQWSYLIEEHLSHIKNEIDIITYQGYRVSEDSYSLVIFDECQRLPANTFSRLALINTKYRIGLSASPHREDGRENFIFALTGFPVGLNWEDYMKQVKKEYHPVTVYVVKTLTQKEKKAISLVNKNKKTFIFSDSLDLGKQIANKLGVPFIFGETKDRLKIVREHPILVVSRVMDLGISIKELEHIIEVDFLFGSRQQELQRTGRLMHSIKKDTKHDIIMTEEELSSYGKRLWSLQEKGFKINIVEEL